MKRRFTEEQIIGMRGLALDEWALWLVKTLYTAEILAIRSSAG